MEPYFKMFIDYIAKSVNKERENISFEEQIEIHYYKKILSVAEQFYKLCKQNDDENAKIQELEKENEQLKKQVERNKYEKIKTVHEIISETIAEKVNSLVRDDLSKFTRTALKRQILETLKWELQVRYANDLKNEHIEKAKEFIQNYKIDDFYLKSS